MGKSVRLITVATVCLWTACGFDTGGSSDQDRNSQAPASPLTDTLNITSHWPSDQSNGIPLDTTIAIGFDAAICEACLQDGLTQLVESQSKEGIEGSFVLDSEDKTVLFYPSGTLKENTWHTFSISPLLGSTDGKLFEENYSFSFLTQDNQPPRILSASITDGQSSTPQDIQIDIDLSEPLSAQSLSASHIYLADASDNRFPATTRMFGNTLRVSPKGNLAGNETCTLNIIGGENGIFDTSGNRMQQSYAISFTTVDDSLSPTITGSWPANQSGISPNIKPFVVFSESINPATVSPLSFALTTLAGSPIQVSVELSNDHRTVLINPDILLEPGVAYTLKLNSGAPQIIQDLSNNPLGNSFQAQFTVGNDSAPPEVQSAFPDNGESRISLNATPVVQFNEALDHSRINTDNVSLDDGNGKLPITVVSQKGNTEIAVFPTAQLEPGQNYILQIKGGSQGICDTQGNHLEQNKFFTFITSSDPHLPSALVSPINGHSAVPGIAPITAAFDEPIDPNTVNQDTVIVLDAANNQVPGTLSVTMDNRVIRFDPVAKWNANQWYSATILNGPNGVRELSGNWATDLIVTNFRTVSEIDVTPPDIAVTINEVENRRRDNLSLPTHSFNIIVEARDPIYWDLQLDTHKVHIVGENASPIPAEMEATAIYVNGQVTYHLPSSIPLEPGTYHISAEVTDLAGNSGFANSASFEVIDTNRGQLPFEYTQVVWVRFDLDRDLSGIADFEEDLMRLGLITNGDPMGTNSAMVELMQEGILTRARLLYLREVDGGRRAEGSIPILFTRHEPKGIPYSQIACGGLDPEGDSSRNFGDPSSGVLGRAYYDRNNLNTTDNNTGTNPGLGIFPAELFLFQAEIHNNLYPNYTTVWGKRFLKLMPEIGGISFGNHFADTSIIQSSFNYTAAQSEEKSRYNHVMLAADDWATAIGIILAHEVGHSVGLVAPGKNPTGLHGDNSLHNEFPVTGDVMSSAVGYDHLVSLNYKFRDLNAAYLLQRIVLR